MNYAQRVSSRSVIAFKNKIKISSTACCGGKYEKDGPLGDTLDIYLGEDSLGKKTFEKGEEEAVRVTVNMLLSKAGIKEQDVDIMFGGDLMNQCTSTGYGLAGFDIPYVGLYGACSTFVLGLLCASVMIDSGHVKNAIVVASSDFCSAERQFRYPLEYGAVPGTTAQTTVTGVGAVLLTKAAKDESGVFIGGGIYGIVNDFGIRDPANMGAAMAPAAADTIEAYAKASSLSDFDFIATGDLGREGRNICEEILQNKGIYREGLLKDCGEMIYDESAQNVGCGGSGCGCSAVVTCGHLFSLLSSGFCKKIGVIGTGAMMSPQSVTQGLSIPAIAHMAVLKSE